MAVISSCSQREKKEQASASTKPLFTLLSPDEANIHFNNTLTEGLNTNVLMYEYFYNGGGVAVGDINGDGLEDIYFVGNMSDNKLYLNKGKMKFEDITTASGAGGRGGPWKTGVAMADVNGDGKLDIYLCYSGQLPPQKRTNQLFINQGNDKNGIPHFEEESAQYGLADSSYSTQAYFFDYDRDGDLDLLLLNHNPKSLPILDEASTAALISQENPLTGVRLFRNDNNHFVDITKKAGISSSSLTYGLGAGIADIDGDGWPDIYISNDYTVPDYLYINNHNGTFTDKLQKELGHTSQFSMGNDVADINNDGLPDIYTLDMLPKDNYRQKLLFAPDNYEKFDLTLKTGFYYQYMRNMLQINNGNGTFSEVGQVAGVANSDWSWAPLLADYDNDGWKDLFVTNGYLRDYTNMDFIKYMNDYVKEKGRLMREDVLELVQHMPSSNVTNCIFKNEDGIDFKDVGKDWGLDSASNSNGAAYADLDNDGDLDLIVNNINKPAFIYENESDKLTHNHYLKLKLQGTGKNTAGIGAKVTIYQKGKTQYLEQMPMRGFQSGVSALLNFGLGKDDNIDSLIVTWPDGKAQVIDNIKGDRLVTLKEADAKKKSTALTASKPLFTEVKTPLDFHDAVNNINDFKRQPLMVNPLSFSGPCLVKADVNGDGLEDIYAGGGNGQAGAIYLQQKDGRFIKKAEPAFDKDAASEDVDAVFFDANGDGFLDLYVCSGGYDNYAPQDKALQDRLYLNDGKGNFSKRKNALPVMLTSTSCVRVADINGDGKPDLFVGGRVIPGRYPETPQSYLLQNDGQGNFKDVSAALAPALQKIGMVTDAAWVDINNDGKKDLIIAGEWMPLKIFINVNGKLEDESHQYFDKDYAGWWNKILIDDFNNDGKPDLVVGNFGLNTQCKVSDKEPADLYYKDFDGNGSIDPFFCFYIQNKSYPCVTKDELYDQIYSMRNHFADYQTYADATINDILTEEDLKGAGHLKVDYLKTAYFQSDKQGHFHLKTLPVEVQFSPVFTINSLDYDKDGNKDLLLCGNINHARLRFGKVDANYGILLKGDGKGQFNYIPQRQSGFHLWGDVRSVLNINNQMLFGINQNEIKAYRENRL